MLRKLLGLIAAVGMLGTVSTTASAGIFLPLDSTLSVQLAALPQLIVAGSYSAGQGWATLTNSAVPGGHDVSLTGVVWQTSGLTVGSTLLTGVPALDNLILTATNAAGSFNSGFSSPNPLGPAPNLCATTVPGGNCIGGNVPLDGQFIQVLAGGLQIPFPLHPAASRGVGIGGTATVTIGPGQTITATFAPWITGKVKFTGIQTNVVQVTRVSGVQVGIPITLEPTPAEDLKTFTTMGGFLSTTMAGPTSVVQTATIGGSQLSVNSSSGNSLVTLISPFKVNAAALGQPVIPGFYRKRFIFAAVPEPGTMLLLASGAAGLIFIGRKRMKR